MVIGVTGKVGSGKTTVSTILTRKYGAVVVDVDKIGHEILEEKREELEGIFGEEIVKEGKVDRKALAAIVFSSEEKLKILERLLHPRMCERVKEILEKISRDELVVVEAALLKRMNLHKLCDHVITVVADEELLISRSPMALERLRYQEDVVPQGVVIPNNGNVSELEEKIEKVMNLLWGKRG